MLVFLPFIKVVHDLSVMVDEVEGADQLDVSVRRVRLYKLNVTITYYY